MFIAFDGADGCGKSTQVQLLYRHFSEIGQKVTVLDMGDSPYFKEYLLAIKERKLTVAKEVRELLYYFEGVHKNLNIIQKKQEKEVVITDRYYLSYLAYGYLNGLPYDEINFYIMNLIEPDCYFYLDVTPQICMERIKRYRDFDFPEIGQLETSEHDGDRFLLFQSAVRKQYLQLIDDRHIKLDASLPVDVVYKNVLNAIESIERKSCGE